MVKRMKPGSVIVDLAAEGGGNCELTSPGADVVRFGVMIRGPLNLAASMPVHASQMYARNMSALLSHLIQNGELHLDFGDEITRGTCLTHDGRRLDVPPPAPAMAAAAVSSAQAGATVNPVGARL